MYSFLWPCYSASDLPHPHFEVVPYLISIRLGDKIYVCTYQTGPDRDLSWTEGKEVEARVSGKAMYVKKANGKEAKGFILST